MDEAPWTQRQALLELSQALEGMAGAIHDRASVAPADLAEASRLALALWGAAGPAVSEAGFRDACGALAHWGEEAGRGGQQALGFVQDTAHRLATTMARRAPETRAVAADEALRQPVRRLVRKYGPHAPHFGA